MLCRAPVSRSTRKEEETKGLSANSDINSNQYLSDIKPRNPNNPKAPLNGGARDIYRKPLTDNSGKNRLANGSRERDGSDAGGNIDSTLATELLIAQREITTLRKQLEEKRQECEKERSEKIKLRTENMELKKKCDRLT